DCGTNDPQTHSIRGSENHTDDWHADKRLSLRTITRTSFSHPLARENSRDRAQSGCVPDVSAAKATDLLETRDRLHRSSVAEFSSRSRPGASPLKNSTTKNPSLPFCAPLTAEFSEHV